MRRWTLPSRAEQGRVILSGTWTTSTSYKPEEIERKGFVFFSKFESYANHCERSDHKVIQKAPYARPPPPVVGWAGGRPWPPPLAFSSLPPPRYSPPPLSADHLLSM